MERVLVLGGTGFVGRSLINRLIGAHPGLQIVVPSRRPARATAIRPLPGVDLQEADVHDPATLTRLASGCDAVVNLVAILQGDDAAFERAHVQLPRLLISAMAAAGVKRLVHVSALGVPDGGTAAPSRYLRSKAAGEAVLRAATGLQASLARPSVIFGAADRFTNLFAGLQRMLPLMALGGGEARLQPVWVEDVAEALLRLLQAPAAALPPVLECAGPEVFTLAEVVRLCGRLAGVERPQIALPGWAANLQALAFEALPGEPLISRDNLASLTVPNVATGRHPGLASLGIQASPLGAVAAQWLGGAQRQDDLDRWRSAHPR